MLPTIETVKEFWCCRMPTWQFLFHYLARDCGHDKFCFGTSV